LRILNSIGQPLRRVQRRAGKHGEALSMPRSKCIACPCQQLWAKAFVLVGSEVLTGPFEYLWLFTVVEKPKDSQSFGALNQHLGSIEVSAIHPILFECIKIFLL
jgi:hypothetical protein